MYDLLWKLTRPTIHQSVSEIIEDAVINELLARGAITEEEADKVRNDIMRTRWDGMRESTKQKKQAEHGDPNG